MQSSSATVVAARPDDANAIQAAVAEAAKKLPGPVQFSRDAGATMRAKHGSTVIIPSFPRPDDEGLIADPNQMHALVTVDEATDELRDADGKLHV